MSTHLLPIQFHYFLELFDDLVVVRSRHEVCSLSRVGGEVEEAPMARVLQYILSTPRGGVEGAHELPQVAAAVEPGGDGLDRRLHGALDAGVGHRGEGAEGGEPAHRVAGPVPAVQHVVERDEVSRAVPRRSRPGQGLRGRNAIRGRHVASGEPRQDARERGGRRHRARNGESEERRYEVQVAGEALVL